MKKTISIIVVAVILATGLFVLTGCENGNGGNDTKKINGVEISKALGNGTVSVVVPKKDDGTAKYEFTTTKPKEVKGSGTFYLETDKVAFSFGTHGLVYNTATKYKQKFGEVSATFEGYMNWVHDPDSGIKNAGWEEFEINGRKAARYYSRTGGSGDYVYHGYNYLIGVDDIYKGSDLEIGVYYKGEEVKQSKEFDQETLDIINSIKVVANKK